MTGGEVMGGALTAAMAAGYFPDTVAHAPEVTEGAGATTVLLFHQHGGWIVCVHDNAESPREGWHVTGSLPEGGARKAALSYAKEGVSGG